MTQVSRSARTLNWVMKSSTCKVSFSSYNTGRFVDSPEILTKPPRKVVLISKSFGSLAMSKLLEQVRDEMRTRHYSYRTEQTYLPGSNQRACCFNRPFNNSSEVGIFFVKSNLSG